MPTLTTKFLYNKPLVNNATDADLWGGQLNTNWDDLDTDLSLTTSAKSATSFNVGATEFNFTYLIDSSSNNVIANLPPVANVFNGFTVRFKAIDVTNTITIDGDGSETIDGATTITLDVLDSVLEIVASATEWHITIVKEIDASSATDGQVLSATGSGSTEFRAAGGDFLHIQDQKSSGTDGGTFTTGAWEKRTLNTSVTNEITGASVSSSVLTLPAGTYYIDASAIANNVNSHKLRLRNTSDSTDAVTGMSLLEPSGTGSNSNQAAVLYGRFTIAAEKDFELQHRSSRTQATIGFGAAAGFSTIEIYSDVKIWKVG